MNPIACFFFLALRASAHEGFPILPVKATLRVEPDRIIADLRADSIFWIEEVAGLHPMPAQNWPGDAQARVESYVNGHFRLSAAGKPLRGALVQARYRQLPWEVNEEGIFFLRMAYPAAPSGATLAGTAAFYEEYRREIEAEYAGRKVPYSSDYRTFLDIPGRKSLRLTLTPEAPSFSIPVDDAHRTSVAMALESFLRGSAAAIGSAPGFPALLAVALCLGAKRPDRAVLAALLASAAAGFVAARFLGAPPWLIWAATLGGAMAAGWRRLAPAAGAAAAGCIAFSWYGAAGPLLPHSSLAVPSALIGALTAGSALLSVVWLGVRAEYRRLADVSESRVDELFARRARLTATALAMVGAYGLWQSLRG